MKFLYKIHSRYDGFTPNRIPERAVGGRYLELGWKTYFEEVEDDDEIWVYFHGGTFRPGVYAQGVAVERDPARLVVRMRIRDYSTSHPLTDEPTSRQIAEIVGVRYRQVFYVPDAWKTVADCSLTTTARSCAGRRCHDCKTWQNLRQLDTSVLLRPWRMGTKTVAAFAPAYWAIPPRSFVYREGRSVDPRIVETSGLFRRFKVGDKNLAYPLALGMFQQLRRANLNDFDAIVPIPLSPDKAANSELHRTRALALELGRLLGAPVRELLSLAHPIGKRALRRETGAGPEEFELEYGKALVVHPDTSQVQRILLVDDACTEGSTLEVAASALRRVSPCAWVVTSTAAQMAIKAVVRSEESLLA